MKRTIAAAAAILTLAAACAAASAVPRDAATGPAPGRFIKVFFPDGRSVTAELAVNDDERARGLMFRESVPAETGMLFAFPEPGYHPFWMKNTLVELDMLWLDSGKRVVEIENKVPPCKSDPCPSYGGRQEASYVLELKGGQADVLGLKVGDRIDFVLPAGLKIE